MTELGQVLWIGGAPGSGKSTLARRLARRYGARLYSADTRTWVHRDLALRAGNLAAARWESLTPDERWNGSSVDAMVAMSLHVERGPMVVEDVRRQPRTPLLIAEGSTVPARIVSEGVDPARTLWLLTSAEVQRERLTERSTAPGPLRLYLRLGEIIAAEAAAHRPRVLWVEGDRSAEDTLAEADLLFAEALAAGPLARSGEERRALLREMNRDRLLQISGYYARPWATGDPGDVPLELACECGDAACSVDVRTTLRDLSTPILAPGHG